MSAISVASVQWIVSSKNADGFYSIYVLLVENTSYRGDTESTEILIGKPARPNTLYETKGGLNLIAFLTFLSIITLLFQEMSAYVY